MQGGLLRLSSLELGPPCPSQATKTKEMKTPRANSTANEARAAVGDLHGGGVNVLLIRAASPTASAPSTATATPSTPWPQCCAKPRHTPRAALLHVFRVPGKARRADLSDQNKLKFTKKTNALQCVKKHDTLVQSKS